jgi:hypothetical protein
VAGPARQLALATAVWKRGRLRAGSINWKETPDLCAALRCQDRDLFHFE